MAVFDKNEGYNGFDKIIDLWNKHFAQEWPHMRRKLLEGLYLEPSYQFYPDRGKYGYICFMDRGRY